MTGFEKTQAADAPGGGGLGALVEAMRIPHWIKNAFVAAPVLFSGRFLQPGAWGRCGAAVGVFCLLSSAAYLINDVCDRRQDQAHPVKRRRPVASGRLSPWVAGACGFLLAVIALGAAAVVSGRMYSASAPLDGMGLLAWATAYFVLNLLYSFWLKAHAIVDVLVVAMGFVLRAMAGAAAISVPISPWLVVCTFTLCLFIALAKRRSELGELDAAQAIAARAAHRQYEIGALEHMLTVATAMAIITYCLYCLAGRTVANFGSAHMVWTIPLVLYGLFRYNAITARAGRSDPVVVLLRDRIMWLVVLAYAAITALIWEYGRGPSVRAILDF